MIFTPAFCIMLQSSVCKVAKLVSMEKQCPWHRSPGTMNGNGLLLEARGKVIWFAYTMVRSFHADTWCSAIANRCSSRRDLACAACSLDSQVPCSLEKRDTCEKEEPLQMVSSRCCNIVPAISSVTRSQVPLWSSSIARRAHMPWQDITNHDMLTRY